MPTTRYIATISGKYLKHEGIQTKALVFEKKVIKCDAKVLKSTILVCITL